MYNAVLGLLVESPILDGRSIHAVRGPRDHLSGPGTPGEAGQWIDVAVDPETNAVRVGQLQDGLVLNPQPKLRDRPGIINRLINIAYEANRA